MTLKFLSWFDATGNFVAFVVVHIFALCGALISAIFGNGSVSVFFSCLFLVLYAFLWWRFLYSRLVKPHREFMRSQSGDDDE